MPAGEIHHSGVTAVIAVMEVEAAVIIIPEYDVLALTGLIVDFDHVFVAAVEYVVIILAVVEGKSASVIIRECARAVLRECQLYQRQVRGVPVSYELRSLGGYIIGIVHRFGLRRPC